ncbi:hypothetical protein [Kineosporia sp. A_224]|uniref:hypothetical protein n=1 Tax=Kineosporia sp. A_224 TaxID=1962180 RepID=UPI000B4B91A2|nr:hypothetical protein [Kineosporia sp. A_224]
MGDLSGETPCGHLPDIAAVAPAEEALDRFAEILRREYLLDEPIQWEETDQGWGANFRGTGLRPAHQQLIAGTRDKDVLFRRALGAKRKHVTDTGPLAGQPLIGTMRRRALRLQRLGRTFGPVDDYLSDLAHAAAFDELVHAICTVTHTSNSTVHSALLVPDRSRAVAVLDHWLPGGRLSPEPGEADSDDPTG